MASAPQLPNSPSPFLFLPQPCTSDLSYETVTNLRAKLLGCSDSVDYLGNIYVYSASFYKCTTTAEHEFLAFRIRDRHEPRRQTVLIVDRVPRWEVQTSPNPGDNASLDMTVEDVQRGGGATMIESPQVPKKALEFSGSSLNRPFSAVFDVLFNNSATPAADMFFISAHDNLAHLCEWRRFGSHRELERIDIDHQNLLVEQVVVLACTVSDHQPFYNLYRHQCYWYAGVIWDTTCRLARVSPLFLQGGKGEARFARFLSLAPGVPPEDSSTVLHKLYVHNWNEYLAEVAPKRGNGMAAVARQRDEATTRAEAAEAERARAEAERDASIAESARMQAKIAELEERLKAGNGQPR
ncbi:hypothetical protein FRC10_003811 [Ceratobasidium sp. 414]|nr:hypothetical protein FRC10_003811 [Ceratobasidium sp. 414]